MKRSIIILTSIICPLLFSMTSCTPKIPEVPKDTVCDLKNYINYEPLYRIEEEKEYFDIDIEKDLFPTGLLTDEKGDTFRIREKYNGILITGGIYETEYDYLSPFKIRIKQAKDQYLVNKWQFRFVNTTAATVSKRMPLCSFTFLKSAKKVVHIQSSYDFGRLTDSTVAYLDNDIDLSDYDFSFYPSLCHGFSGVFLNPEKHVIKSINYEANHSTYNSILGFYFTHTWFDSLIFEDLSVSVTRPKDEKRKPEKSTRFAIFAEETSNCIFSNIKVNNLEVTGDGYEIAALTNTSRLDSFIDCEISGEIINEYDVTDTENNYSNCSSAALANTCYILMSEENYGYYVSEKLGITDDDSKEEIASKFAKLRNKLATKGYNLSDIRRNKIEMNLSSTDTTGGLFGYFQINSKFFTDNTFEGEIKGKRTGEFFGTYTYTKTYQGEIPPFEEE